MKSTHVWITLLLLLTAAVAAAGTPSFLRVGREYRYDQGIFKVLALGNEGWIQAQLNDKVVWMNMNMVSFLYEITEQQGISIKGEETLKKTMSDMRAIGTACEAYAVDNNRYPTGSTGSLNEIVAQLEPMYIRRLPLKDSWGNEFKYYVKAEAQDYWLISYGSDGSADAGLYDSNGIPTGAGYGVRSDLSNDIIFSNGDFERYPQLNVGN